MEEGHAALGRSTQAAEPAGASPGSKPAGRQGRRPPRTNICALKAEQETPFSYARRLLAGAVADAVEDHGVPGALQSPGVVGAATVEENQPVLHLMALLVARLVFDVDLLGQGPRPIKTYRTPAFSLGLVPTSSLPWGFLYVQLGSFVC